MVEPLNTYGLDTWHLPTVDAQKLMLSLLTAHHTKMLETLRRADQADNCYVSDELFLTSATAEWLETLPTRVGS